MKHPTGREDVFALAANGNQHAYALLLSLFKAADIADNIEDEEKEAGRVSSLLCLMSALPGNLFYQQHQEGIRALMLAAVVSWDLSNVVKNRHYAARLEQIVFYVALLTGGFDLAKRVALEWHNRSET